MNDYTRDIIKKHTENNTLKIPDNYELVDSLKDIPMEHDDMIFHWLDNEFYRREWWAKNEPYNSNVSDGIVIQEITVIRPVSKPRIHVPVNPEKLRVIRNAKRLIKRQL